jgi:hypothetical protein
MVTIDLNPGPGLWYKWLGEFVSNYILNKDDLSTSIMTIHIGQSTIV